jgi:hypothetical protein
LQTHHLTNWIGDAGFVLHAHCKLRQHNPAGDPPFSDAKVTESALRIGVVLSRLIRQRGIGMERFRLSAQGRSRYRCGRGAAASL